MITKNCCTGCIFTLKDKCGAVEGSKHNYVIINDNADNPTLGLVQCMSITSMMNKEIKMEIPIILSNNMVSYVVPYNIHSFTDSSVKLTSFKGCVQSTFYITKKEFMKLLVDIYLDNLNIGIVNHQDVIKRVKEYKERFWEENKEIEQYRDFKSETKSHAEDKNIESSIILYTSEKDLYDKKGETVQPVRFSSYTIPYKEETISNINLETLSIFNKNIKDIDLKKLTNKEILLFIKASTTYTYDEISCVIPNLCINKNVYKEFKDKILHEAELRSINIQLISTVKFIKPCSEWKNEELLEYINLYKNHKNDYEFLKKISKLDNVHQVNKLIFDIKKEIGTRNLTV